MDYSEDFKMAILEYFEEGMTSITDDTESYFGGFDSVSFVFSEPLKDALLDFRFKPTKIEHFLTYMYDGYAYLVRKNGKNILSFTIDVTEDKLYTLADRIYWGNKKFDQIWYEEEQLTKAGL